MTTVQPIYLAGQTYVVADLPGGRKPHISLTEVGAIFDLGSRKQIVALNSRGDKFWDIYRDDLSGWIAGQIWKASDADLPSLSLNWSESVNWHPDNVLNTPSTLFNRHTINNFSNREGLSLTVSLMGNASPFLIAGRKPQIEADGYRLEWAENSDYNYDFEFTDIIHIDQIRLRFTSQNDPTGTKIILRVFKSSSTDMPASWAGDVPAEDVYVELEPTQTDQVYDLRISGVSREFSIELEPVGTGEATIVVADWIIRPINAGHFYRVNWDSDTRRPIGISLTDGTTVDLVDQNKTGEWTLASETGRFVQRMNAPPSVNDDERFGFVAGSLYSTINTNVYECLNPTRGQAEWDLLNSQLVVRGNRPGSPDVAFALQKQNVPGFYGNIETTDYLSINNTGFAIRIPNKEIANRVYSLGIDDDGLALLEADSLLLQRIFLEGDIVQTRLFTLPLVESEEGDALVVESKVSTPERINHNLAFKNLQTITVEQSVIGAVPTEISDSPAIQALSTGETSKELYFNSNQENVWSISRVLDIGGFYIFVAEPIARPRLVWDENAEIAYLYRPFPAQQRLQIYPSSGGSSVTVSDSPPAISTSRPDWAIWRQETETEIRTFIWAQARNQYVPLPVPWFQRIEGDQLVDVYVLNKPMTEIQTSSTFPVADPEDPAGTILRNVFLVGSASMSFVTTSAGWHYQIRVAGVWQPDIKVNSAVFTTESVENIDGLRAWFPRQDPTTENPAFESTNLSS